MAKSKRDIEKRVRKFIAPFRIEDGKGFRAEGRPPGRHGGLESERSRRRRSGSRAACRCSPSTRTCSTRRTSWAVLLVFQAMDAAGKDGTIKHVMSGVNPQGVEVYSFKAPSSEELDHDFLWRTCAGLPERGRIGIFNRSYYEEMLVVRVHPRAPRASRSSRRSSSASTSGSERFEDINAFERYLDPQRHRHPEVLPPRLEEGAEEALPRAARRTGQELEVLDHRRRTSASTGTSTWRPTRT